MRAEAEVAAVKGPDRVTYERETITDRVEKGFNPLFPLLERRKTAYRRRNLT